MKTRTYFFESFAGIFAIGVFAMTVLGLMTWWSEVSRIAEWRKAMRWLPNSNVQIFDLRKDELSKRINLYDKCYRYRTFPRGIKVVALRNDPTSDTKTNYSLLPDGDNYSTREYPYRWFRLKQSGTLFVETRMLRDQAECAYLQKYFYDGWAKNQKPKPSPVQKLGNWMQLPSGSVVKFDNTKHFDFCTRVCTYNRDAILQIKVLRIIRTRSGFRIVWEGKNLGKKENFLLFATREESGYGGRLYITNERGQKFYSSSGLVGKYKTKRFNSNAKAMYFKPKSKMEFWVEFSVNDQVLNDLNFYSPALNGHQAAWRQTGIQVYDKFVQEQRKK